MSPPRSGALHAVAAVGAGPDLQLAAQRERALAHAEDPVPLRPGVPAGAVRAPPAGTVVLDGDRHVLIAIGKPNNRARPSSVTQDVGERLLHDAIRGQIHSRRQRPTLA